MAGSHSTQATISTNFLIVDALGVYNAIIKKPTLNALRVIASTYQLALKFPTPAGVGVIHGNQVEARCYYTMALKGKPNTHQKANPNGGASSTSLLVTGVLRSSSPGSIP